MIGTALRKAVTLAVCAMELLLAIYTGPTCGAVIVHFPPIPPVTDGLKIPLTLFTDAEDFNEKLNIAIKKPNTAALRKVLSVMSGQVTQGSVPGAIGIVTITLPRNTATVTYEPRQRNVFVAGIPTQQEAVSYFDQFNLVRGLLRPGCCDAGLQSSCHGTHTVSLLSPCQWNTTRNEVKRTDGLVFAKVTRLSLPTSLSGLKYREKPYLNDLRQSVSQCSACDECNKHNTSSCYCYTHTHYWTHRIFYKQELWPSLTSPK